MTKVARLQQEIHVLRHELAVLQFDRDQLYRMHGSHLKRCAGGDCCKKFRLEGETGGGEKGHNQALYIAFLEDQIKQTRLKYHKQMGDVKSSAQLLETKLQDVRQEMSCITARVRQMDKLKKNVQVLKSKLQRRDSIIARYNEQYTDFVGIINQLDDQSENLESEGCDKDRENSKTILDEKPTKPKAEPEPKRNFVCLNAALRKKFKQK